MSKGCKPRPMLVKRAEYERNWDRAFGKKTKKKKFRKQTVFVVNAPTFKWLDHHPKLRQEAAREFIY